MVEDVSNSKSPFFFPPDHLALTFTSFDIEVVPIREILFLVIYVVSHVSNLIDVSTLLENNYNTVITPINCIKK
jgi:hypothetical protein